MLDARSRKGFSENSKNGIWKVLRKRGVRTNNDESKKFEVRLAVKERYVLSLLLLATVLDESQKQDEETNTDILANETDETNELMMTLH